MSVSVTKVDLENILFLRGLFLHEINAQVRYNAVHERGWSDSYIIREGELAIGYGSVHGYEELADRDTIFEFYIIPTSRHLAYNAFAELLKISRVNQIECQTNDRLFTTMAYQFSQNMKAVTILFDDERLTDLAPTNTLFRARKESDVIFKHFAEPEGTHVLEQNNTVVATGGFYLHYNFPYADIYMEVEASHRRKGMGSFIIQELKKQIYLSGRAPAARTGMDNPGSRASMMKAGLRIAGHILLGTVKSPH